MNVTVQISKSTPDAHPTLSITAEDASVGDVFDMMLAATETVIGREVVEQLQENGASPEEASFAAPLRTRLLVVETLLKQPFRSFEMVILDL